MAEELRRPSRTPTLDFDPDTAEVPDAALRLARLHTRNHIDPFLDAMGRHFDAIGARNRRLAAFWGSVFWRMTGLSETRTARER